MALLDGGGFRRGPGAAGSGLGLGGGAAGTGIQRSITPPSRRRRNTTGRIVTSGTAGRYSRPVAPPPAAPGPISADDFLGSDVGYQDQLRKYAKSLSDFNADVTRRKGTIGSDYGTSEKALGEQRVQDLDNLESDYGSRGLLRSGLYGTAVGDYEKEYNSRLSELARRRDEALAMLTQEANSFTSQQELDRQAAREAALRRRAEGLGV